MSDRHRGEEPESFDWLYGTPNAGVGSGDATEVLPGRPEDRGSGERTEQTRVFARPAPDAAPPAPPKRIAPTPGPGGPGGQPPKATKTKKRRRIGPGRIVLIVVVLWVAYMILVPLIAWNTVSKVDAEPDGARPPDQPGTTYLLVGSDSREGLTKKQRQRLTTGNASGQRTDTIMLLHTGDGPNLLMSIPRDSIVDIPGHGSDEKINAAYAYGGPELLVQTVEGATGIRIDNYIEVGFGGFVNLVNAVDGITICPKKDMVDPLAGLDVKKGCQNAGGRKALAYARSRHSQQLGDIDRAENQREVVAAVGNKAFKPSTFLNPFRYYKLSFAGAESVTVGENVGPIAFANFANAMRKVSGSDGLTCGIPIRDLAVHWDEERSQKLFRLIKEDRTSDVGKNLCQQSGLAQ